MSLAPQVKLDPSEYVVAPHTAALDEFRMTNDSGDFVANITPEYLNRLVAHMNDRETATGDLSPIVIGHTMNGLPETEQPPLVGFARNWHIGTLGNTGRKCAFFDAWIKKDKVELVKQYPRRSCEVWASRHEVDPISLLGATTPARDLGLMKLSREGSMTFYSPGDMNVADEPKKPSDPKETGEAKGLEGILQQILAGQNQLLELLKSGQGAGAKPADAAAPGAGAEAAPGAAGGSGDMSEQEFNALMQELMAGEGGDAGASRNGEGPPVKTEAPKQEPAKMSRDNQPSAEAVRIADLEAQVARMEVKDKLVKLARPSVADPEDAALIEDLVAMPRELRERQIDRFRRTPAAPGDAEATHLNRALDGAITGVGGKKRITNREEVTRLMRRATAEGKSFEQVAAEEGYDSVR